MPERTALPMPLLLSVVVTCALACAGCSSTGRGTRASEPDALPAADYIVRAFEKYPLVALSEMHGNTESQALFTSVVGHPRFANLVSDIVVEFGNARYQPVADRYLAGETVPRTELSHVWQDTTQITGIFTLPMYEELLLAVRNVNLRLDRERRIRVWLGDPPIDWDAVTSPADENMNDWRDALFGYIVENRIRKEGRRALLFIGGAHVARTVIFPNSLIPLLDARRPGETLVVSVLDIGQVTPRVATALRTWRPGVAASVHGTWLGGLDVSDIGFRFSRGRVDQDVDAVALLSDTPLTYAPPPPIASETGEQNSFAEHRPRGANRPGRGL
jgi:hypothetical protein